MSLAENVKIAALQLNQGGTATATSPDEFLVTLLNDWVWLILGAAALASIIYSGLLFMTAQGDIGKLQKAKNAMLYSIIGILLAVTSVSIVVFFNDLLIKGTP